MYGMSVNIFNVLKLGKVSVRRTVKEAGSSNSLSEAIIRSAIVPNAPSKLKTLCSYLIQNVIHHEPGRFLILNKPYGVSSLGHRKGNLFKSSRRNDRGDETATGSVESVTDNSVTIEDAIPNLARYFQEPNLKFCTGLKRYITGPFVLPANNKEFGKMYRSHRTFFRVRHRAFVICFGRPVNDSGFIQGYATFQHVRDHNEYIFVKDGVAKKQARISHYAVTGSMEYKVLAYKYGCSLIDIEFPIFNRHLPRLMLTELMSPILGDSIYARRIVEISGERVCIEPKDLYRTKHIQPGAPELEKRLRLSRKDAFTRLPLYFHVYKSIFPHYEVHISEHKDLVAFAPPPSHMKSMFHCLEFTDVAHKHLRASANETDNPLTVTTDNCFSF